MEKETSHKRIRSAVPANTLALFLPSLSGGGAERMMLHLAKGFRDSGYEVDLVLARKEGEFLTVIPDGIRVVDLRTKGAVRTTLKLAGYLRSRRPSALLATIAHANLMAIWARMITRVKTRIVVREACATPLGPQNMHNRLFTQLKRIFYPRAHRIIAVSEGVAELLVSMIRLPQSRVIAIDNPVVTTDLLDAAEAPVNHPWFDQAAPVILAAGRLVPQKDYTTLLEAFAIVVRDKPAKLIILGDGPERDRLAALSRQLGVSEDVSMPGFVINPFPWMARADAFVLSSRFEGLPGVLIQAMACGCPVVSTDCPSGPAEILGGRFGKLVPVADPASLARAISEILEEQCDAAAAKEYVLSRFSFSAVIPRYLQVLVGTDD